ncbi:MAG TPA: DNA mismatch repair protein MutS [Gemmatimonadales bacterium]|nr:DNA mismatch repair protein MutS [Gemmatimonadales bacterium]
MTPRVDADTPLMQQYRDIKARQPDTILFFRMGDFYEMFEDDARLAARELGLTLTSRNNGGAADVPLAGVPAKAATEYLRRLIGLGHRVAICEQVEDPKLAKGLVRREIVETVTPGTVLADDWLERRRNNFLVAVDPRAAPIGLAALDLTTGELLLETASPAEFPATLARYEAAELILPTPATGQRVPSGEAAVRTEREAWEFDPELAREDLTRTFQVASLEGLGVEPADRAAVGAAGALLRYARELKPGGLPHVARPRILRTGDVLPLDEMTRRNLELVEPLRAAGPGERATTLLDVLDRTLTPMGARLLRRWLLAPLVDAQAINARLDAVEVLARDARGRDRVREALDGVRDVERLVGRTALGRTTPRELGLLRDSLARLPDVRAALDGLEDRRRAAALEGAADRFDLLQDLSDELARALVDRPPGHGPDAGGDEGDGDAIRAGYDRELDALRDARDGGKRYIAGLQARERERTGIGSLKVGFNKVFGYYLEVTNPHRDRVPADYERRQTLTGAERYVTPELKAYEANVLEAEERSAAREGELLGALRARVGAATGRVQASAAILAQLDVWCALAELAHREGYVRPEVNDAFTIALEGSRHPVVERMMAREAFIPNDVRLDAAGRVILLTGPNMAGKSTLLRQVGLCVVLAQMGAFVPARRAVVGVVDRLFTRVGASDNLARGQSTFMVEMSETSAILHGASVRSLVLLDEIGRGTSTYDGVAIAWAVTEFLHTTIGCKTVFATHYHELTQLTEELEHARNFNVAVREAGDEVVFLHRLEPGGADRSYGIHVGRLAGLPAPVVGRAWEVLRLLEAGHHVARQAAPAPPDAAQLALFAPGPPHPLLDELHRLNVDRLSPLEALNQLAAWKERLEREGKGRGKET